MNAALDSPLEGLALNHLAYVFLLAVNNIWAWIAVVTAAVSFWRVRSLSLSSSTPELMNRRIHEPSASTSPPQEAEISTAEPATNETRVSPPPAKAHRVLEREGSVKMKYSLHYEEEGDGGEREESGGGAAAVSGEVSTWRGCDEWERMMVMRMGDMGWYRWQDRTVLDGSVVRLWEGRRSPRHAAAHLVGGGVAW